MMSGWCVTQPVISPKHPPPPGIVDAFRHEKFDPLILKEMGKLGLLGAYLDGYGCAGVSQNAYGLIAREMERVEIRLPFRPFPSSRLWSCIRSTPLRQEQKQKYLRNLAAGTMIGCFGLTEPDGGSDPSSMRTNAKKAQGGFILNGSKQWITNSPIADIAIVWARSEDGDINGFIVERGMKGFETPKIDGKMSLRASITGGIMLDDVFVPKKTGCRM